MGKVDSAATPAQDPIPACYCYSRATRECLRIIGAFASCCRALRTRIPILYVRLLLRPGVAATGHIQRSTPSQS